MPAIAQFEKCKGLLITYLVETKLLYVTDRKEWRDWLTKHYKSESEVWLVYYRKHSGKPRISYNDAVEEALCFGWIDGQAKSLNDDKFLIHFSRQKDNSMWSDINKH